MVNVGGTTPNGLIRLCRNVIDDEYATRRFAFMSKRLSREKVPLDVRRQIGNCPGHVEQHI